MSTQSLYNEWAATYDSVENPTRDLEMAACRRTLGPLSFKSVLELGAGTGKNTVWLAEKAEHITADELSSEMQAVAKRRIRAENVSFEIGDITKSWNFAAGTYDLITCSLVLEHVSDLGFVFENAFRHLAAGGHMYVCELHPFKQYSGSKARFDSSEGVKVLECFTHHISDYMSAASNAGFSLAGFEEWFDDNDRAGVPRLASFLFGTD
jgi:ubiquinone/menaquinone biosynthesis C-methylase UbiE